MTRKLCVTTLALAFAGGVYLTAAQPASASNMGFKLERDFQPVDGFLNEFFVSMPLFNGLGDIACTSGMNSAGEDCGTLANKCVNGEGSAPTEGDGIINADDLLCDIFDGTPGAVLTVSAYDIDTCSFLPRGIQNNPIGAGYLFLQSWTDPLPVDEGLRVTASYVPGGAQHPAVIVGSHNPSFAGKLLSPNATCLALRQTEILNLPYHTMYQNALEILCGLNPEHWERDPGTGEPIWKDIDMDGTDDPCGVLSGGGEPVGTYSGTTITVSWFDNVDDNTGPAGTDTDNTGLNCRVAPNPLVPGEVLFPFNDECYDLIPGEAYILTMSNNHATSRFLSPHF